MQGHGAFSLSPLGRQQAEKLAHRLRTEDWLPSLIYSSPLQRAVQTTEILVSGLRSHPDYSLDASEISVHYADELKEFQTGIFTGLTWSEAMAQYPDLCRQLEASADWIPIPAAESLQDARDRARRFINHLLHHHQDDDLIWIITHSWILQHLIAELLGCDRSWRFRAHHTALFEFWLDRRRWHCTDQNRFNTDLWQVRRFNDWDHLRD